MYSISFPVVVFSEYWLMLDLLFAMAERSHKRWKSVSFFLYFCNCDSMHLEIPSLCEYLFIVPRPMSIDNNLDQSIFTTMIYENFLNCRRAMPSWRSYMWPCFWNEVLMATIIRFRAAHILASSSTSHFPKWSVDEVLPCIVLIELRHYILLC